MRRAGSQSLVGGGGAFGGGGLAGGTPFGSIGGSGSLGVQRGAQLQVLKAPPLTRSRLPGACKTNWDCPLHGHVFSRMHIDDTAVIPTQQGVSGLERPNSTVLGQLLHAPNSLAAPPGEAACFRPRGALVQSSLTDGRVEVCFRVEVVACRIERGVCARQRRGRRRRRRNGRYDHRSAAAHPGVPVPCAAGPCGRTAAGRSSRPQRQDWRQRWRQLAACRIRCHRRGRRPCRANGKRAAVVRFWGPFHLPL